MAAAGLLAGSGCAHCPLCGRPWPSESDTGSPEPPPARIRRIAGSVSCPERVTVLPTFEIRVRLITLEAPTEEGRVMGEDVITGFEEFPVPFEIEFSDRHLDPAKSHGLVAELFSQGALLFATDTQYKVDVNAPGEPVNLVIVRVDQQAE